MWASATHKSITEAAYSLELGIALKSHETRIGHWGGNVNHKSIFNDLFLFRGFLSNP